ncbi:MAG: protein-disulfide reductase DsbD domain-containing protein [Verrucomicrobiota bacterium]
MNKWVRWFWLLALAVVAHPAQGAFYKTDARLVLSATAAKPGDTVLAGVHLTMDKGWHIYWRYGGDSGYPTSVKWTLPPGITAKEVEWPLPEKYYYQGEYTYVYHDETTLLVPLTIAPDAKPGAVEIKANIGWLECEKICVPGKAEVTATLTIGDTSEVSPDAALLEAVKLRVPHMDPAMPVSAQWEAAPKDGERPVVIEFPERGADLEYDFFPYGHEDFSVAPSVEKLASPAGVVRLRKIVRSSENKWPDALNGVLVAGKQVSHPGTGWEMKLPLAGATASASAAPPAAAASSSAPTATPDAPAPQPARLLPLMLFFAFIGGLILNIMPCVLPVIALKILGFVNQSKEEPKRVRKLGLIYGLGVLVSFLVMAGIVIGVKQAGAVASWGMQFQNTQFVVVLTILVTLVALNLFGLFEITLGGGAMGAASELASKEGPVGAFFNGVLATALATPCTAPFLGAALGFAFAQPAPTILLMFLTVGLGLAAPYVVLSWNPAWLKFLPKPGAWMEKFKIAMGFPMLGTAVWLFSLAAPRFGKGGALWFGIFLVVLALAVWIWGEFVQRGRANKGFAMGLAAVLILGGYAYILEGELRWRAPVVAAAPTDGEEIIQDGPNGIPWRRWSLAAVERARKDGKVVLVDFTADWCLTCKVNKKTSIEIPGTRTKLKELGAVALLGDFTASDPLIYSELQKYGRAGVPLVLVYPADASAPPIVLPEVLTPGIVQDALDKAAAKSTKLSQKNN